jgi:hypothetical protein
MRYADNKQLPTKNHVMRYIYSMLLLLLLSAGCVKEVTTMDRSVTINTSSHSVTIRYYHYVKDLGTISYTRHLPIGGSHSDTSFTGQEADIYNPYRFASYDSARVIFDHSDSMTHYQLGTETLAGKFYLFNSTRNLMNINSYHIEVVKNKRQFQTVTYIYTFTDQDYKDVLR